MPSSPASCAWAAANYCRNEGKGSETPCATSSDNGNTWTGITGVAALKQTHAGICPRTLSDGSHICILNPSTDWRNRLDLMTSTDGVSWSLALTLNPSEDGYMAHYPQAVQTADGKLHVVFSYGMKDDRNTHTIRHMILNTGLKGGAAVVGDEERGAKLQPRKEQSEATTREVADAIHVTVRHEKGRFFGWPANGGIWSWGNEILMLYKHGEFQDKPIGSHDINFDRPIVFDQSRSLDGGLTWMHHATTIVSSEDALREAERAAGGQAVRSPLKAPALTTPIDFSDPNTILKFDWAGYLYYSTDRGVNWRGPYQMPMFDIFRWQLRTDYLVEDKNTCIAFWSGSKEKFKRDENGGMVYMVKTTDGGLTWTKGARVSRLVDPAEDFHDVALMPSTVRISSSKLVTCIRNLVLYPKVGWIDCRFSNDNGKTWRLQSIPVNDKAGTTPPALSRLSDGRLVLTYGYRRPLAGPTSIRARISEDQGATWGEELILRTGGGDEDIGYTRNAVRPDGKVVTIYYWQEDEKAERDIAATIWTPSARSKAKSEN
jgi:hypothetical protein